MYNASDAQLSTGKGPCATDPTTSPSHILMIALLLNVASIRTHGLYTISTTLIAESNLLIVRAIKSTSIGILDSFETSDEIDNTFSSWVLQ